jgi:two-component system sensor histidine kinase CssS
MAESTSFPNRPEQTTASEQLPLGEFVRHVAHELSNPVAAIKLSSELLQSELPQESRDELMDVISEEIHHLETLIERTAYYATLEHSQPTPVTVAAVLASALLTARRLYGSVEFNVNDQSPDIAINADASMLMRLFEELLHNAVDAGAGVVEIAVHRDDRYVEIAVSDDGQAREPIVNLQQMFTPFYTTREGRLGVGLSIVSRICAIHQGTVRAELNQPSGLRMIVAFPAAASTS